MVEQIMEKYFHVENEKDLEMQKMREANSCLKSSMILQIATQLLSCALMKDGVESLSTDTSHKISQVQGAIEYASILYDETSVEKIMERDDKNGT